MLRAQDYATVELISAGMGHKVLSGRASGLAPLMSSHAPIGQCREVCQISAWWCQGQVPQALAQVRLVHVHGG